MPDALARRMRRFTASQATPSERRRFLPEELNGPLLGNLDVRGGGTAARLEVLAADAGEYPPEWPIVAWLVKTIAGWRCERCGVPHGPSPNVLTVHHLDGVKSNLEHWNLSALCQRCHLRVQARVTFQQDWPFEHRPWMARHVEDYNTWAALRGLPLLSLVGIEARSYENEWPEVTA